MSLFGRKKRSMRKVEAQIEALQSDLRELRRHASAIAGSAGRTAGDAIEGAHAVYDSIEGWTSDNARLMRGSVRNQPLTALLVSLGAGAVLGALFLRR